MSGDSRPRRPTAIDIDSLPNLPELSPEERARLERDLAHPMAVDVTERLYQLDSQATTREGEPAPDFDLPRLGDPQSRVRLADHFAPRGAGRPVALVFGSYT